MATHFLFDSAQLGTLLLRNRASGSVPQRPDRRPLRPEERQRKAEHL